MKCFLLGATVGLILGWITVPIVKATFSVPSSGTMLVDEDDNFRASHAYKWYLQQMLSYMKSIDQTLKSLDVNIKAVKDKLHA